MQDVAKSREGKCLSNAYVNSSTKIKWMCKYSHNWEAVYDSIKAGSWCPYCGGSIKGTIEEMQNIAKSREGECLSKIYINNRTKLKWKCKEGHIWEATPGKIKMGRWCPKCSQKRGERICREYFETIFNEKFPAMQRLEWLINSKGNKMEIDGYCENLSIAFEYNGIQHYKKVKFFNIRTDLKNRKIDDDLKKKLCEKHKIKLIEIPFYIDYEEMGQYIIKECKKNKIIVPKINKKLDYKLFNIFSPDKLKEMQELAKLKGGECLSKNYIGAREKLKWKCKQGHTWEAAPYSIKSGNWCQECYGNFRLSIKDMNEIAKKKGGKCLSKYYKGMNKNLRWQCNKGHVWETTPSHIKRTSWCPNCAGLAKGTIEEMQKIAKSRGGKCLSKRYINSSLKLKWKCRENHEWGATPECIKRGNWCPYCCRNIKLTIEQMQEIAKSRGGLCLSKKYITARKNLLWQCKEGHGWGATPDNIKRGTWCPRCKRKS